MQTKLSEIIIGCMSWGAWGKQHSTSEMINLIHFCLDHGISSFDHADIYGDYTTETAFGKAFIQSGVDREKVQLISKCGIQYVGNTRSNRVKHYNYSKEYIIWSAEESLKNLQTDYLDVLLLHRPSPLMHPDEISEAVELLQKQGKIIDFGVSNFTPSQMDLIQQKIPITTNQIEFSLTQNTSLDDRTLDYFMINNIKPMCWSPLGTVFKESSEQTNRIMEALIDLSKKYNATPDQLLLAWIYKHPAQITPVIGTTNTDRIKNAAVASKIDLSLEDWFWLLEKSRGKKTA
jgi:predicted oxidoreductase